MGANDTRLVTRVDIIDHRRCKTCHGSMVDVKVTGGKDTESLYNKCSGTGIMCGRVLSALDAVVALSYQDDGRTLNFFIIDIDSKAGE